MRRNAYAGRAGEIRVTDSAGNVVFSTKIILIKARPKLALPVRKDGSDHIRRARLPRNSHSGADEELSTAARV